MKYVHFLLWMLGGLAFNAVLMGISFGLPVGISDALTSAPDRLKSWRALVLAARLFMFAMAGLRFPVYLYFGIVWPLFCHGLIVRYVMFPSVSISWLYWVTGVFLGLMGLGPLLAAKEFFQAPGEAEKPDNKKTGGIDAAASLSMLLLLGGIFVSSQRVADVTTNLFKFLGFHQ